MKFIGLDVGTTNCKAGLFDDRGKVLAINKYPTKTRYTSSGDSYYEPGELWASIFQALKDVINGYTNKDIYSIGIASMAEAGLLIDKDYGIPRSNIIPWFDKRSMNQYERIKKQVNEEKMFKKTGLHPSYKYGLSKIMWLNDNTPGIIDGAIWLSVADFIAYKLTGNFGTDYSLAARTYLFRIDKKQWDYEWMGNFGLSEDLFAPVSPSGAFIGKTTVESGIVPGIPVSVAGHDHICAALAVGAIDPGTVFDSMGTAETLFGAIPESELGENEYNSGLSFGCHVVENRNFWLGGLSAAGGSIEWFRRIVGERNLSYQEMKELLQDLDEGPTGILYYPYISGSGAPLPDPKVRGALIGLNSNHSKSHIIKAILEGTAYEMESIRRSAAKIVKEDIRKVIAVGGGTNNLQWMKIKSNISGTIFEISSLSEATTLGAALVAAIGNDYYKNANEAVSAINIDIKNKIVPEIEQHKKYKQIYENNYMDLQQPLRNLCQRL